jgi:hypothetical protein
MGGGEHAARWDFRNAHKALPLIVCKLRDGETSPPPFDHHKKKWSICIRSICIRERSPDRRTPDRDDQLQSILPDPQCWNNSPVGSRACSTNSWCDVTQRYTALFYYYRHRRLLNGLQLQEGCCLVTPCSRASHQIAPDLPIIRKPAIFDITVCRNHFHESNLIKAIYVCHFENHSYQ